MVITSSIAIQYSPALADLADALGVSAASLSSSGAVRLLLGRAGFPRALVTHGPGAVGDLKHLPGVGGRADLLHVRGG